MGILIRNAQILTLDRKNSILGRADIFIQDGIIVHVGQDLGTENFIINKTIDAQGKLAMPGLINAHCHSDENFLKGCFDNLPLEIWMLYRDPPAAALPITRELVYLRTLVGAIEMLKSGITTVQDDCVYPSGSDLSLVDAVFQAYADCGIRAIVEFGVTDRHFLDKFPFLRQELPVKLITYLESQRPAVPSEQYISLYEFLYRHWNGQEGGRLGLGLSPSAPQRCSTSFLEWMIGASERWNLPLNLHIQETKMQVVTGWEFYKGRTVLQYAHDIGLLTPRTSINHAIWLSDKEIDLIAKDGSTVIHLPKSNLKLGSGLMPFQKLQSAGVNIALGTDGISSNDNQNLFEVMKLSCLLHRLSTSDYVCWPRADQILQMATYGGAKSCLLDEQVGCIAEGYRADLLLIDLSELPYLPINDLKNQLVFFENGSSIDTVIVDGQIIISERQLRTLDETAILDRAREVHKDFKRHFEESMPFSDQLEPYFSKIYWHCVRQPMGINCWLEDEKRWVKS